MRLILIRHGHAEDSTPNHTDDARALTLEGRERLENAYPSLARFLNTKETLHVWTSPKKRAVQTAEILCRYTPTATPVMKPYLAGGDFDAFCEDIRDHSHGETLVVIGHEPYLSDWVRLMTGMDVHFKKGRGEMLYLMPAAPKEAIRINNLDFSGMNNLDLYSQRLDLGIGQLMERQHAQIIQARDAFMEDPDENANLSDLRVALRRQYALLEFIRPYCDEKPFKRAEAMYLSLYRDLEDLRSINSILKSIHNSRRMDLVPLADALMIEQNSEVMELCDAFSQLDSQGAFNEALHLTIAALMTSKEKRSVEELAREQFVRRYHAVHDALTVCDLTVLDEVEGVRALCKTSRYLFEDFSPLANYPLSKQYLYVRRLNQCLSHYYDSFYNLEHMHKLLGDDETPILTRAMHSFRALMNDSAVQELAKAEALVDQLLSYDKKHAKAHAKKDKNKDKKKDKKKGKKK